MSDKVIVTIDREFGSGGHEVARRLAERLDIPFYDEEIIARAAESTGYNKEYQKYGLHSHNPAYATISFTDGDSVKCVGKVLGKIRQEDWADEESYSAWQEFEQKGR